MNESFVIELSGRVTARCRPVTARRGGVLAAIGWENLHCASVVATAGSVPIESTTVAADDFSADSMLKQVSAGTPNSDSQKITKVATEEGLVVMATGRESGPCPIKAQHNRLPHPKQEETILHNLFHRN